ncbi:uncharacterized protein BJX67DRAFT_383476 [Aspergillus lucknowensis]|uniref:Rhodopsin domain-containing protein n=1 Tax=Aspergillus lucknowensis TaxID=176173 RepID=A0ABR4LJY2_9EURO
MLEGRSKAIIIVIAVTFALSLATVSLRCWVRLRLVRSFGWDDGFMVLAMAFNVSFAICGLVGASFSIGRRLMDLDNPIHDAQMGLLCWYLGQISYILTTTAMRQSIVFLLFRFTFERAHRIALYLVSFFSFAVGMIFLFFTIFQCRPVQFYWHRLTMEGRCLDINMLINIVYFYSSVAAACDLTIGVLPALLIRHLRVSRRTKIGVAIILGIGCVSSAAVLVRIPFLTSLKSVEFLYATYHVSIWSNLEASLGIIAGSLAPLRPLARIIHDAFMSLKSRLHMVKINGIPVVSRQGQKIQLRSYPATDEGTSRGSENRSGVAQGIPSLPDPQTFVVP